MNKKPFLRTRFRNWVAYLHSVWAILISTPLTYDYYTFLQSPSIHKTFMPLKKKCNNIPSSCFITRLTHECCVVVPQHHKFYSSWKCQYSKNLKISVHAVQSRDSIIHKKNPTNTVLLWKHINVMIKLLLHSQDEFISNNVSIEDEYLLPLKSH